MPLLPGGRSARAGTGMIKFRPGRVDHGGVSVSGAGPGGSAAGGSSMIVPGEPVAVTEAAVRRVLAAAGEPRMLFQPIVDLRRWQTNGV